MGPQFTNCEGCRSVGRTVFESCQAPPFAPSHRIHNAGLTMAETPSPSSPGSARIPSGSMSRALTNAESARGRTGSNPWVGAVLERDGRAIRESATGESGHPHAEAAVLAGIDARGATLYVTLEPCVPFEGKRTRPCCEEIIASGVEKVVVALPDPDTRVNGRGIATLRAAGISVEVGDGYEEALSALLPYVKHRQTGIPYVTAKFAASLDGRTATATGDSRWITGPEARERVHRERTMVDAIMVGSGTVLADDPALTARPGGQPAARQPLRVVLDSRGRTPSSAGLLDEPGSTLVATTSLSDPAWRNDIESCGAELLILDSGESMIRIGDVLRELGERGILRVWCEGGGNVLGSLFRGGHVDEVWGFIAPLVIGGTGLSAIGGEGAATLADAWRLVDTSVEMLGNDVLMKGQLSTIEGPTIPGADR